VSTFPGRSRDGAETNRRQVFVPHLSLAGIEPQLDISSQTLEATDCASGADGKDKIATSFLDQTIEWEKTYFYRGAVVTVVEAPGKTAPEVEGDDSPEVKIFAHDVSSRSAWGIAGGVFRGRGSRHLLI